MGFGEKKWTRGIKWWWSGVAAGPSYYSSTRTHINGGGHVNTYLISINRKQEKNGRQGWRRKGKGEEEGN